MDLSILILDDEKRISAELSEYLIRKGFIVKTTSKPSDAFQILAKHDVDLMILDIRLPEMDGISVLKRVKSDYPDIEVILISGHGDMDTVIDALRSGATDFLKKPFRQQDLLIAIERTAKFVQLQQRIKKLKTDNSLISQELERNIEKTLVGESTAIKNILDDAMKVASFSDTPVIISGESGTGKEIIARIIHYASPRRNAKFCPVNCAAIPENLMESEFFGYKRGTFTGALSDKRGFLEAADKGSIFLDEITEMPTNLQSKLLRVLEEHKFMKLGSETEIKTDVRFLCATNKNIALAVKNGDFRNDLFYRLSAYRIEIPPLRDRVEDIEPLMHHYVNFFCQKNGIPIPKIENTLLSELSHYSFPGNVRELKNLVERALIINRSGVLSISDFPVYENLEESHTPGLVQSELKQIKEALQLCKNNQSRAANMLGISRFSLIRKLKKYDLKN